MINVNLMSKECKLYLGGYALNFGHYDNPKKARDIMAIYFSGSLNTTRGCFNVLDELVSGHKNCNDLDLALDEMFSVRGQRVIPYPHPESGGGGSGPLDPDANGSWGNLVKEFEENTNHNPFLLSSFSG